MTQHLPEVITKRMKALRRRVRRLQLYRGLLGVGTVSLAGLLVVMAADYILAPLPSLARWGLFIALVVAVAAMAWAWLCKPLLHRISLVQVARWLETRHPEIQERVSTALELSGTHEGVSESLLGELIDAAKGDVEDLDPGTEVRGRRMRRSLWPAISLAAVFLLLFLVWPSETGRLLARAVAPFSETGNAWAARFEIAPGDMELLEGDALEIVIRYTDPRADRLVLAVAREDREWMEETLAAVGVKDGASEFVYRLPAASESFRYRARIGKAESDAYRVRVWPLPRIEKLVAGYEFPAYTNRAPEKRPLGRGVKALTGTGVHVEGVPNTPVESGRFLLDGKEAGRVAVTAGAAGGRIAIDWTMEPEASGLGQVLLMHRLGREVEGLRFPVTVVKDEAPVVTLVAPRQRELRVRPTEQITMEYEVQEDVGIEAAKVDLRVNGRLVDPLPMAMPGRDRSSPVPLWQGRAMVSLGAVVERWSEASEVKMRVAVADTLPEKLEGPGIGYSEWVTVTINRGADSLVKQELQEQQSDLREALAKVEQDLWKAKEKMDASRNPVAEEEVPKWAREQLDAAREKLTEAEESLHELAERLEHGVQASKQEAVSEIAREAGQAREKLENTSLQDTGEDRQATLDEAREATREAIEDLQKLREAVQQDQQRFEELGQLSDLAQQEEQIARNAGQRVEEQGSEASASEPLRQKQEQIENALRQHLQQNPQARAEALKQQAEEARSLSEQAHELSDQQAALAEMSRNQAEADQAQADQGEGNQNQEVSPPEAGTKQDALAEQLRGQLALEQEKILEETNAQAAEARMHREQRADFLPEAMEALAAGDAGEAMQALQEMQAADAASLAEAIGDLPQVDGPSGAMAQAAGRAQQGGQRAAEAARSGRQGRSQTAARQHGEASSAIGQAAEALAQAAAQFGEQAAEAAGQQPGDRSIPAPPGPLAEAFQQSAQAADAQTAGQASQASRAAAQALGQAVGQAMQSLKQGNQPGPPGQRADQPAARPGDDPQEGPRAPQADPGVPPELAKLGVSAADWEKLKEVLRSDVAGGGGADIPEDYRGLVRKYFEQVAKGDR